MFQTKVLEKTNTHFTFSKFSPKFERLRDNVGKYCKFRQATDDNKLQRMRFPCWIPKATGRHSEYVILIAFPLQQWLHEGFPLLRYTTRESN